MMRSVPASAKGSPRQSGMSSGTMPILPRPTMPTVLMASAIQHSLRNERQIAQLDCTRRGRATLRTMALHRIGVRRVDAHVDALLPGALQRIAHLQRHLADVLHLDV